MSRRDGIRELNGFWEVTTIVASTYLSGVRKLWPHHFVESTVQLYHQELENPLLKVNLAEEWVTPLSLIWEAQLRGRTLHDPLPKWLSQVPCVCIELSNSNTVDLISQIEEIHIGLEASLLVKAPGTGELFVNFDPQILTLFRETECMSQMSLEVSPFAAALFQKRDVYKKNFSNMKV